jgi:hypothetical protein
MSFILDDTTEREWAKLAQMEAGVEPRPLHGKGGPREPSSKQSVKSRLCRQKPEARKSTRDFIFLMTGLFTLFLVLYALVIWTTPS